MRVLGTVWCSSHILSFHLLQEERKNVCKINNKNVLKGMQSSKPAFAKKKTVGHTKRLRRIKYLNSLVPGQDRKI